MTVRRTKSKKRSRPRRDKGQGGVSPPSRARSEQREAYRWTEQSIDQVREIHAMRTDQARATDEALVAPIAPTPSHWIRYPERYDIHGVDYPGARIPMTKKGLPPHERQTVAIAKQEPMAANPMQSSRKAKAYMADLVEKYRRKLGVEQETRLSVTKTGRYPAHARHYVDEPSKVHINYEAFARLWDADPELTRQYMEYALAHELAHQRQREELGFKGMGKARMEAEAELEVDADYRAFKAMGISEDKFKRDMKQLAEKLGGAYEERHPGRKAEKIDLSRFKDHTPVPAPEPEPEPEIRERMKELYVKGLGHFVPSATKEELELIAEKAIEEEWIKPDDDARKAMQRVAPWAQAELIEIREKAIRKTREEQLKALRERSEEVKKRKKRAEAAIKYYGVQVMEAGEQGDLDEIMALVNADEDLTAGDRLKLAAAVEERRETLDLAEPSVTRKTSLAEYDAVVEDRVPRMVRTWKGNLHKTLTDQGYPRDEVEKLIEGFTSESVLANQAELLEKTRQDERVLQTPSKQAERDALAAVMEEHDRIRDEYLRTRRLRFEEWEANVYQRVEPDLIKAMKGSVLADIRFTDEEKKRLVELIEQRYDRALELKQVQEYAKLRLREAETREEVAEIVKGLTWANVEQKAELMEYGYEKLREKAEKVGVPEKLPGRHRYKGEPGALVRPKGTQERVEFYRQALPYTYLHQVGMGDQVTVQGGEIKVLGMDPSHVAMMTKHMPNRLGLPDGNYHIDTKAEEYTGNLSLYRYPDKVEWIPGDRYDGDYGDLYGEILLTKGDKSISLLIRRGHDDQEIPEPRIAFKSESKVDVEKLKDLVDGSRGEHIRFMTYQDPGDPRKRMLRAWWNEERAGGAADPISHAETVGEVTRLDEPSSATFTKSYLEPLVEHFSRTGVKEGRFSLSTDMPLKLDVEGPEYDMEFYLAPCIGVDKEGTTAGDYYPDNPRTTLTRESIPKQEWRNNAVPYTAFMQTAGAYGVDIRAEGPRVTLRSMDRDHVSMVEVETANILGIPDGSYSSDSVDSGNQTTYRHPEELSWDPELREIIALKAKDQAVVRLQEGEEEVPSVKMGKQAVSVYLKDLSDAVDEAWKAQKKKDNQYATLRRDDKTLLLEYETKEYDRESGEYETKELDLGAYTEAAFEPTSYDMGRLRDHLEVIKQLDPDAVNIRQNERQILTVESRKGDTVIRYSLAPIIRD
jgi:hypothetical protein